MAFMMSIAEREEIRNGELPPRIREQLIHDVNPNQLYQSLEEEVHDEIQAVLEENATDAVELNIDDMIHQAVKYHDTTSTTDFIREMIASPASFGVGRGDV